MVPCRIGSMISRCTISESHPGDVMAQRMRAHARGHAESRSRTLGPAEWNVSSVPLSASPSVRRSKRVTEVEGERSCVYKSCPIASWRGTPGAVRSRTLNDP